MDSFRSYGRSHEDDYGTSSAVEVAEANYYARGMYARKDRTGIQFRVGQVYF